MIQDYITKRGLTKWRTWPVYTRKFNRATMPGFFTAPDFGDIDPKDKFEIYANGEHTHFVSVNTTRGLFRIVHYDTILFYSQWQSMQPEMNYPDLPKL